MKTSDPLTPTKPAVAEVPAKLENVVVLTFAVRNPKPPGFIVDSVEVPQTSDSQADTVAGWAAIRAKHPKAGTNDIRRTGSHVTSRSLRDTAPIPVFEGMTIRQLFPDGTEFETFRRIGRVVFDGAPHDVILRFIRARAAFSVTLKPLSGPGAVNFSQQVNTNQLVTDLPRLVNEILDEAGASLDIPMEKVGGK